MSQPVCRILISDAQINNLRGINERFSFRDLWRTVFLTEENTSDMLLTWCHRRSELLWGGLSDRLEEHHPESNCWTDSFQRVIGVYKRADNAY